MTAVNHNTQAVYQSLQKLGKITNFDRWYVGITNEAEGYWAEIEILKDSPCLKVKIYTKRKINTIAILEKLEWAMSPTGVTLCTVGSNENYSWFQYKFNTKPFKLKTLVKYLELNHKTQATKEEMQSSPQEPKQLSFKERLEKLGKVNCVGNGYRIDTKQDTIIITKSNKKGYVGVEITSRQGAKTPPTLLPVLNNTLKAKKMYYVKREVRGHKVSNYYIMEINTEEFNAELETEYIKTKVSKLLGGIEQHSPGFQAVLLETALASVKGEL